MTLIGTPAEWVNLVDNLVPTIFDLIISTLEDMSQPMHDEHEDPITERLCKCLRQNRNASNLPFRIDTQLVELEPADGENQGRMDIVFSPLVPRENIYFCLECKRLNVFHDRKIRSYASEYVQHGMMRFIRSQYSVIVHHAGMLGYVLDGEIERAIQNVSTIVQTNHLKLGMKAPGDMLSSSIRPMDLRMRETQHIRESSSKVFSIHHFFI